MLRKFIAPVLLIALATAVSMGCRACQSCTDYSAPVAGCNCACYGSGERAGSAWGGMVEGPTVQYSEPTLAHP
jgi:hypothetical protein